MHKQNINQETETLYNAIIKMHYPQLKETYKFWGRHFVAPFLYSLKYHFTQKMLKLWTVNKNGINPVATVVATAIKCNCTQLDKLPSENDCKNKEKPHKH